MAATRANIERWFDEGVEQGAHYMIVMCDTFDWSDYPVYVMPGEAPREVNQEKQGNMNRTMECYNLRMSKLLQMSEHRAQHWDDTPLPKDSDVIRGKITAKWEEIRKLQDEAYQMQKDLDAAINREKSEKS